MNGTLSPNNSHLRPNQELERKLKVITHQASNAVGSILMASRRTFSAITRLPSL